MVKSTGTDKSAAVKADGLNAKIIINGGEYTAGVRSDNDGNAAVETRNGGEIEILDGYFYASDKRYSNGRDNVYFVLNNDDTDNPEAKITVKGGEFVNFNPARPMTDPSEDACYLATGYRVEIWHNGSIDTAADAEAWETNGREWNKYAWAYNETNASTMGITIVYKVVE